MNVLKEIVCQRESPAAEAQSVSQQRPKDWRTRPFPSKILPMPTVLRSGPYRLFFYSADRGEPRHVHVARDDCRAKFWLDPVRLDDSTGFAPSELGKLEAIVTENATLLRKAWDDFFAG